MEPLNKDHRNAYALITGATSGIGYELAKLFAQDGAARRSGQGWL